MTNLLAKVKDIKNILLGLEMDLDILEADLFELTSDLNHLIRAEKALAENIEFLKKDGITAVVSQYKDSKDQIKIAQAKIFKYTTLRNNVINTMKNKIESKNYYQKEFNLHYKMLENDRVLLVFKKRKVDNGEKG